MRYLIILSTAMLLFSSCKQDQTKTQMANEPSAKKSLSDYPEGIQAVFDAHGGMETWEKMQKLTFTIPKGDVKEKHTVHLKSRNTRIETDKYILGYDGKNVWLEQDSTAFNPERARFYHNLMFYFYAMPFVLGDDGISYEEVSPLEINGTIYPGTKISFGADVGDAPDDNYILYRDPKSNEMAWLAYTVTYGKEGPSERYSFIKYDKWQEINGLKLPKELQWYNVEDGKPTEMRNAMTFDHPTISKDEPGKVLFSKPESVDYIKS